MSLPEGYQLDQPGLPAGYSLDEGTSAQGAAGRGALDALPFGTKGAAALEAGLGEGKYKDYLKELDDLLAQDKEGHPIAHGAGEVAGSLAPFAIPGVGEALGAESLAGRAGIGAGIGALQGASNTRAPLMSSQGMGDVGKSAALGGILNPALGAVGDAISSGAGALAPKLEDLANSKAVQASNLRPGSLGLPADELQELGQKIRDWDLVSGTPQERVVKSKVLLDKVGAQIGDMGAGAQPLQDSTPFIDNLQQEAMKSSKFFGTEGNADLNTYRQGIANIQNNAKDFDSLQALKSAYGEKAFDANGQVANPAAAKVYGQIKDAMKSIVSSSPEEYQQVMNDYGTLKDVHHGLLKSLQQEQAGGLPAKGFGMAGKLGAMVTGGNPIATGAGVAALAPTHPFMAAGLASTLATNPQMVSNMAGKGASMLGGLASSNLPTAALTNAATNGMNAPKIPPQYAPVFQKATQGLTDPAEKQKQMTITDFVLQSRDPNYSKAKKDMENETF